MNFEPRTVACTYLYDICPSGGRLAERTFISPVQGEEGQNSTKENIRMEVEVEDRTKQKGVRGYTGILLLCRQFARVCLCMCEEAEWEKETERRLIYWEYIPNNCTIHNSE